MPSRPSAAQPEFFFDRSLGRRTAAGLRGLGWILHLVGDHFPNDGQQTTDEEWLSYGVQRGWSLLAKDKRIRHVTSEREALSLGTLFVLSNGNLLIDEQVAYFHDAQSAIYRHAGGLPMAIYVVYKNGRVWRQWPRQT
jgi:hypothetical protein